MKGMTQLSRSIALATLVATGGLLSTIAAPAHAAGTISTPTNGTQACRATNSAGASSFYYNHTYLWNNGSTNQYLTCVLPDWNLVSGGQVTALDMAWAAGATGGTVTCTVQVGGFYWGANNIVAASTKSLTLAAGESGFIIFASGSTTPLTHSYNWDTDNIICNVPAGFKLGLIERQRAESSSL